MKGSSHYVFFFHYWKIVKVQNWQNLSYIRVTMYTASVRADVALPRMFIGQAMSPTDIHIHIHRWHGLTNKRKWTLLMCHDPHTFTRIWKPCVFFSPLIPSSPPPLLSLSEQPLSVEPWCHKLLTTDAAGPATLATNALSLPAPADFVEGGEFF
jgi:hypothetical protein